MKIFMNFEILKMILIAEIYSIDLNFNFYPVGSNSRQWSACTFGTAQIER